MTITALRVPDARSYRFITPNIPDAPKLARDHVAALLRHFGSLVPVDTARLLVSEVVTNAHQHTTADRISLTTTIQSGGVRVDVYDNDPTPLPTLTPTPTAAECGRGLLMVHTLAARWGWDLLGEEKPFAKSVWLELLAQQAGTASNGGR